MKISSKIIAICLALVGISTATFLATTLIQRGQLFRRVTALVLEQGHGETTKLVLAVYDNCISAEARNQSRLTREMTVAREILFRSGQISFDTNTVRWNAINQLTGKGDPIQLPRLRLGGTLLEQNTNANRPSPVVDEVRHLTDDHCTIFQRMNEDGDMLRVDTSVISSSGARAIGTFIPHQNPDGSANTVIATVLKGETYRGRAFVVNEYHDAAYEPIWDAGKTHVVGMLYVGVSMADLGTVNK
jgi:methyl-accepting chemotaxis protein